LGVDAFDEFDEQGGPFGLMAPLEATVAVGITIQ